MLDILAIGDVTIDHFFFFKDASVQCSVDRSQCKLCLNYADKVAVQQYVHSVAGNAANVAVGSSRLGLKTALATLVGDDSGGREILHKLQKEGIDTNLVRLEPEERTNISSVLSFRGERTIMVYHAPRDWDGIRFPPSRWIYFTSVGPRDHGFKILHDRLWRHLQRSPSTMLAMNPGTFQLQGGMRLLKSWIKRSTFFFVNKQEAELILTSGRPTAIPILLAMLKRRGAPIPVITDGAHGSWALGPSGNVFYCPIFPAHDLERTGAGDSFATGVLAATIRSEALPEALRWGSANSASVVGSIGPQQGLLKLKEIKKVLRKNRKVQPNIVES